MIKNTINDVVIKQIITIFFIETSSSAAFAFFFSGISLFLTQQKFFSEHDATVITGLFLSLNYFLPLIGGVLANYLISCKKLYCMGIVMSLIGCYFLSFDINLYLGLSLFLMSSLVTNVCLKMFITNLFEVEQRQQRRIAFMWSYIGMNAGFLLGFFISGYSFNQNNFADLFRFMAVLLAVSAFLTFFYINETKEHKNTILNQLMAAASLLTLVTLFISILFQFAEFTEKYIAILLIFGMSFYLYQGFRKVKRGERNNFVKFIGYSLLAIVFWSLYMLTPIAFMQLIDHDVQKDFFGIHLAPQWFMNADSIIILIIAPMLAMLMSKAKSKLNQEFPTIYYFQFSFFICVISLLVLLSGFYAAVNMKIPAWAMLGCLVFLAIGETFVSPIGDSLIGELIPSSLHAMMMGYWSMNIGIGAIVATHVSNLLLLPYVNKNGLTPYNLVKLQQNISLICGTIFVLFLGILTYNQIVKRLILGISYKDMESKI